MNTPDTTQIIQAAISGTMAVQAALNKDPLAAVGHALDAALVFVPADQLQPYLTEAAIRRVKLAKAAGDLAKFGIAPAFASNGPYAEVDDPNEDA